MDSQNFTVFVNINDMLLADFDIFHYTLSSFPELAVPVTSTLVDENVTSGFADHTVGEAWGTCHKLSILF